MNQWLFVKTADRIEEMVQNETFRPGEKLPSLRKLHRELGISVGTALQAYILLSDRGIVAGKEKSGFFVVRKPGPLPEAPSPSTAPAAERSVTIQATLKKVTYGIRKKNFVSFFSAVPVIEMLPFASIRRSVQVASRDLKGEYISYEATEGNLRLRELIARRSFHWKGLLRPEDILITNGTLEAINLCLRATTSPGDTVVVETPCYYGILQCIENLGLKAIELPSDPIEGVDTEELERVCKKFPVSACLFVSNFNNPNGVTLTDEKKKTLAAFARKTKTPIIEDDIYGELYFGSSRPTTIKTFDQEGWVLLCSSFSKTLVPGFRVGWCAAGRFSASVLQLKAVTNVATSSLIQQAMCELLQTGSYDRHLRKLRFSLNRQIALAAQVIESHFPDGTKISKPLGGYVLWIELPKRINAVELQKKAIKNNVDFAPGPLFSIRGEYKNYIRISCNNVWNVQVERALKKLGELCTL